MKVPQTILVAGKDHAETEGMQTLFQQVFASVLVRHDLPSVRAVVDTRIVDVMVFCHALPDGLTPEGLREIRATAKSAAVIIHEREHGLFLEESRITSVSYPAEPATVLAAVRKQAAAMRKVLIFTGDIGVRYRAASAMHQVGIHRNRILDAARLHDAEYLMKVERIGAVILDCTINNENITRFRRDIHQRFPVVSIVSTDDKLATLRSGDTLQYRELEYRLGPVVKRIFSIEDD